MEFSHYGATNWGKVNEAGEVVKDTDLCALSNVSLADRSWVTVRIDGTPFFYKLTPMSHRLVANNPALRESLEQAVIEAAVPSRSKRKAEDHADDAGSR